MAQALYRGYSTVNRTGINSELYNIELVKQDLRNTFMTRLGERRGRPLFGSIIPDLLMELFDDTTEGLVLRDAHRVIRGDPRVREGDVQAMLDQDAHAITVRGRLFYVEFNMNDEFEMTFTETL